MDYEINNTNSKDEQLFRTKLLYQNQTIYAKITLLYSNLDNKYEPTLPLNIIECKKICRNKLIKNITEKPQFLLEFILKYYSNKGDGCLDMTMGSGSCGVACKNLERRFIGIEINKAHFEVAKKRLSAIN